MFIVKTCFVCWFQGLFVLNQLGLIFIEPNMYNLRECLWSRVTQLKEKYDLKLLFKLIKKDKIC